MTCVSVCPAAGALDLRMSLRRRSVLSPAWVAAAITVIFLGTMTYARLMGYWETNLPDSIYLELIPRASEFGHP
jgi:hypothetical protein